MMLPSCSSERSARSDAASDVGVAAVASCAASSMHAHAIASRASEATFTKKPCAARRSARRTFSAIVALGKEHAIGLGVEGFEYIVREPRAHAAGVPRLDEIAHDRLDP